MARRATSPVPPGSISQRMGARSGTAAISANDTAAMKVAVWNAMTVR